MPTQKPFVALVGGLASGKSTTGALIAKHLGWSFVTENFEAHPFLQKFYEDPHAYGFETELAFFAIHAHQLNLARDTRPLLTDFSITNNLPYAENVVDPEHFDSLLRIHDALLRHVPEPDLTIFLDVPPDVQLARIKQRGRRIEQSVTLDYLTHLRTKFLEHLKRLRSYSSVSVSAHDDPETVAASVEAEIRRFSES
jgi:deoxyadenosine/deoxycytidine kinase